MIGYILALLPLYILVWVPISNIIFGTSQQPSDHQNAVFNSSFVATDEPLSCPPHNYNTFILSQEPLIVYIENFLSTEESAHLVEIRYLDSISNCEFATQGTCLGYPANLRFKVEKLKPETASCYELLCSSNPLTFTCLSSHLHEFYFRRRFAPCVGLTS